MSHPKLVQKYLEGTKRVNNYDLRKILHDLDEAFWLLEVDPQVLKDAERPMINDPDGAKDLIQAAIVKLEELDDTCLERIDYLVSDLNDAARSIKKLKLEVYVQEDR
jgi:hypothetical protein